MSIMSETLAFFGIPAIIDTVVMLIQGRKILLGTYFGLGSAAAQTLFFNGL